MCPNGDVLARYPEAPQQAGNSVQLLLLDTVGAVDVGWWVPWAPFRNGSWEVTGITSATAKLWTSNAASMPGNGYTVTVGGSATLNDHVSITIHSPQLLNGYCIGTYVVQGGDSVNVIAAGLEAALTAALLVQQQQLANSEATAIAASEIVVSVNSAVITIITNNPSVRYFTVTTNVTGAASETLTKAQYDSGLGFNPTGGSVTSNANVPFSVPATWIKSSCSAFSSGAVTAIVQGAIP